MSAVPVRLPIHPAVRHVRLSAAHRDVLFGTARLQTLLTLSSGLVASDGLVGVAGRTDGELLDVRVLLPLVARTEVLLTSTDAAAIGLTTPGVVVDDAAGCTLHGPAGVVVLASAVVNAERVVLPSGERTTDRVDVAADYERLRIYRRVAVVVGEQPGAWLVDDTGELRRHSTGVIVVD